ncbi:ABC transporter substrate-binding protein, partial [archaeon]|nr:ABC transporter substrate-binding protein [archaeon]
HECNYPKDATLKPIVIDSVINSDELSSKEIDTKICQLLKDKKDIFVLNEKNLKNANPDLIISQETCEVCAAYTNQVNKAIQILQKKPTIFSMNPHSMDEIVSSIIEVGKIIDKKEKSKEIANSLSRRIENIRKNHNGKKIKVLAIEWIEPFFTAGHWIPEMIEIAGGINMISKTGEHSRRLDINEISKSSPDIIVLMPCGFDTQRTVEEYEKFLKNNSQWKNLDAVKKNQIFAVDANSFFSKPSIRTIEGIEIMAKIIQPDKFKNLQVSEGSFVHIENN